MTPEPSPHAIDAAVMVLALFLFRPLARLYRWLSFTLTRLILAIIMRKP